MSQMSQVSRIVFAIVEMIRDGDFCCFPATNSSLRLTFLRSVEGLAFFFVPFRVHCHCLTPGVQGESEVRPSGDREVEDLALAGWQKARHLARESSPPVSDKVTY